MQTKSSGELLRLMQLAEAPDIISFGGGFPGPEIFPSEELEVCAAHIIGGRKSCLQYASTSGYAPLREKIAERASRYGAYFSAKDVMISAGSQQAIDLSARIFCDPGDLVLVETPTYIGALNAFSNYGVRYIEMPTDEEGVITDALDELLSACGRISCTYVIPDFQNPTGRRWSIARRNAFLEIMARHDIPVIEDGAYRELSFEDDPYPPLLALADASGADVVHLGSFSKIFCPGFRVGWVITKNEILSKYTSVKPDLDLSASSFGQQIIDEYLERYNLNLHISRAICAYRQKRDMAAQALRENLPETEFSLPRGGLFIWLELPQRVDATLLLEESLKRNVAFVPGTQFFASSGRNHYARINYSNISEELIAPGIVEIGEAMRRLLQGA